MDEASGAGRKVSGNQLLKWAAIAAAVGLALGLAVGIVYVLNPHQYKAPFKAAAEGEFARYAQGSLQKLETSGDPKAAPAVRFNDRTGAITGLEAFKGKVVVLNLWATWCAPCVTEMPTLAALQRGYEGKDVIVVPVSVDRPDDLPDAKSFIDVHEPLPLYHDPKFSVPSAFGVKGLPATIVLDRKGREIARLTGESDWNSPEARALIDAALKEG